MYDFMENLRVELEAVQNQLREKTVSGASADGLIKVTVNGHQEVTAIYLNPQTLYPKNQTPLQDAIMAATNEALKNSRDLLRQELSRLTGEFDFSSLTDSF